MYSLEKSLDYMTVPAILLNINKKIIYKNDLFLDMFNINNIDINYINDECLKQKIENPQILDKINDDIENTKDIWFELKDENKKWIRVNSLIFKNGTINYIIMFENLTEKHIIPYIYEEILNNTNMGILVLSKTSINSFIIKNINPIGCEILKDDKNNIINSEISKYITNDDESNLYKNIVDVSKNGIKKEIKKIKSNDKYFNITIIKVETGEIIVMIDDITVETNMVYKLERSDKYKTEFLSNMSHEIRSPINSIIGFSELLKDVKDDQEKKEQYINIIQNSSESLTKIINDILDITKIQDGKLEINNSNFYLNSIMEELFLINKTKIKNVNITLKLNIPKEDTMILSDNLRFVQIFNNLLNNAIKFTKNGFIEFGYFKKKDTIKFYVKDTGIGIKKEEQQKIFDRYTQIKNIKQEKIIGYGLGLSISKELVDLMGGELKLESEYNNGSYFYFELPYNKKKKIIKNLDNQKEIYNYDFTGKNILIVEDIDFNIKLLQSYLEDTNANIIIATDGNEAILKYNENKQILDIILMDIQLPEMDGTDVTKIIRTIDKETPIIAQTAYAMKDDIDTIMNYGFNDILNKPIKKDDLLKIIYMYL